MKHIISNAQFDDGQDVFANLVCDKDNGFFLDFGVGHPRGGNNTFSLEKFRKWNGFLFDNREEATSECKKYRKSKAFCFDLTKIDINKLLAENNCPEHIDFASFDVDEASEPLISSLDFNKYKFTCFTFEHNLYSDDPLYGKRLMEKSREIFLKNGYFLIFPNVSFENGPFEDWYVSQEWADKHSLTKHLGEFLSCQGATDVLGAFLGIKQNELQSGFGVFETAQIYFMEKFFPKHEEITVVLNGGKSNVSSYLGYETNEGSNRPVVLLENMNGVGFGGGIATLNKDIEVLISTAKNNPDAIVFPVFFGAIPFGDKDSALSPIKERLYTQRRIDEIAEIMFLNGYQLCGSETFAFSRDQLTRFRESTCEYILKNNPRANAVFYKIFVFLKD